MPTPKPPTRAARDAQPAAGATVAGTVAIVGRPNVGKSTLLNRIVGEKLAIVTPKPQTTRNRIVGVWNGPAGQIVFVDTPGIHDARSELNRFMVSEAMAALEDVDAVLLVIEAPTAPPAASGMPAAARRMPEAERRILERVAQTGKKVVLAVNKVDTLKDKTALLPWLTLWQDSGSFAALVPMSAKTGVGVDAVVAELVHLLPQGEPLYGPDMLTDRSERFLAGELVREQLFLRLRQELPYATAVVIESWEERAERGDVVVDAVILVERDSQRGIVIGKGGSMIRDVGTAARKEIAELIGRPCHLRLDVRVSPDWSTSRGTLQQAGYGPGNTGDGTRR